MTLLKIFFGFEQIDVSSKAGSTLIFEEIKKEVEEYLLEKVTMMIRQTEFSPFYLHCWTKFKRNLTNYLTTTPTRNVSSGH